MATPKTLPEWAPVVGLLAAWVLIAAWLSRVHRARVASESGRKELRRRWDLAFAWGLIGGGVFIVGGTLARPRGLPPGEGPGAALLIIAGALFTLFGAYRLYRPGR